MGAASNGGCCRGLLEDARDGASIQAGNAGPLRTSKPGEMRAEQQIKIGPITVPTKATDAPDATPGMERHSG